jgi:hypothetical protein
MPSRFRRTPSKTLLSQVDSLRRKIAEDEKRIRYESAYVRRERKDLAPADDDAAVRAIRAAGGLEGGGKEKENARKGNEEEGGGGGGGVKEIFQDETGQGSAARDKEEEGAGSKEVVTKSLGGEILLSTHSSLSFLNKPPQREEKVLN